MGLYLLQIKKEKDCQVIDHIRDMGINISRTELDSFGTRYFIKLPKQNNDLAFSISHERQGRKYFRIGLSKTATQILDSLDKANFFEPFEYERYEGKPISDE